MTDKHSITSQHWKIGTQYRDYGLVSAVTLWQ